MVMRIQQEIHTHRLQKWNHFWAGNFYLFIDEQTSRSNWFNPIRLFRYRFQKQIVFFRNIYQR